MLITDEKSLASQTCFKLHGEKILIPIFQQSTKPTNVTKQVYKFCSDINYTYKTDKGDNLIRYERTKELWELRHAILQEQTVNDKRIT